MSLEKEDPKMCLYTMLQACATDSFNGDKVKDLAEIFKAISEREKDPGRAEILNSVKLKGSGAAHVRGFWKQHFEQMVDKDCTFFGEDNKFTSDPESILLQSSKEWIMEEYFDLRAMAKYTEKKQPKSSKSSNNAAEINAKMKDTFESRKQKILVAEVQNLDTTLNETDQFYDTDDKENAAKNEQETRSLIIQKPKSSSPKQPILENNMQPLLTTSESGISSLVSSLGSYPGVSANSIFSPTGHHGVLSPIANTLNPANISLSTQQHVMPQFQQLQAMNTIAPIRNINNTQADLFSEEHMERLIAKMDTFYKKKIDEETKKIHGKIASQNADICANRNNILSNKITSIKNSEDIRSLKNVMGQQKNEEIGFLKRRALWTTYRCEKEDYRNHVFGRLNSGTLKVFFTNKARFCELQTD